MGSGVFFGFLLQLFYFIGAVFIIGLLIYFITRMFYSLVGYSRAAIYISGFIGTPIHELSHAVCCIIFGHKIEEMRLFQIDEESGMLGYVSHSYNKRNIWALIGNYFIGTAPILVGSAVLYLLMSLLIPTASASVGALLSDFSGEVSVSGFSKDLLDALVDLFLGFAKALFNPDTIDLKWIIFIIVAACISLHMNLSGLDIKGALPALPLVALVLLIPNLLIGFIFPSVYGGFVGFMNGIGGYLMGMLLLSVFLALVTLTVAFVIKLIIGMIAKLFGK